MLIFREYLLYIFPEIKENYSFSFYESTENI